MQAPNSPYDQIINSCFYNKNESIEWFFMWVGSQFLQIYMIIFTSPEAQKAQHSARSMLDSHHCWEALEFHTFEGLEFTEMEVLLIEGGKGGAQEHRTKLGHKSSCRYNLTCLEVKGGKFLALSQNADFRVGCPKISIQQKWSIVHNLQHALVANVASNS